MCGRGRSLKRGENRCNYLLWKDCVGDVRTALERGGRRFEVWWARQQILPGRAKSEIMDHCYGRIFLRRRGIRGVERSPLFSPLQTRIG